MDKIIQFCFLTPPISSVFKFLQNNFTYKPRIKKLNIHKSKIPLFNSVFLEVCTKCNGLCSFCAASVQNETRKDTIMPKELYEKVIDELKPLQFSGIIAPYVNNDPLLYPYLTEFVEYARKNLPSAWIQIQTNGKALSVKMAESLILAGLDEININFYNDDFTAEFSESIKEIRDVLLPKLFRPSQLQIGNSPPFSEPYIRGVFVFNVVRRKLNEVLTSRAGTAPNKKHKSGKPRGFCEYPFTQFNITADGKVAMCCADFYFSIPVGNVKDENLINIWKGEKFTEVRTHLLQGNRDALETCRKCDFCGIKQRPFFVTKLLALYHSLISY